MNKYLGFPPKKDVSIFYIYCIYIYTYTSWLKLYRPICILRPHVTSNFNIGSIWSQTHPKSCWCMQCIPSQPQKGSRFSTLAPKRSEESCATSCWRAASCATTNMPRRSCRKRFSMRHSRLDQGNTSVFSVGTCHIYIYISYIYTSYIYTSYIYILYHIYICIYLGIYQS